MFHVKKVTGQAAMDQQVISTRKGFGLTLILFLFFLALFPIQARAGIYIMVDANGVYHFTNVPNDKGYRPFIKNRSSASRAALRSYSKDPTQYEYLIKRYAKKYGVDTALIKAIIHAESDFNPYAVSSKGAQGLMQIMPGTARDLSVQDVFDPEDNIRAGVQYLKMLLKKFKGNLPLSLAAYNAGPNLVNQYGKIPPYRETKDYIKKVLTYYRLYR